MNLDELDELIWKLHRTFVSIWVAVFNYTWKTFKATCRL